MVTEGTCGASGHHGTSIHRGASVRPLRSLIRSGSAAPCPIILSPINPNTVKES